MGQLEDQVKRLSVLLELAEPLRERVAATLLRVSTFSNVEPGDRLYTEGDEKSGDGYVLLQGDVSVQKLDGFEANVQAPALVGEMQQFHLEDEEKRFASVIAGQNVAVLHFDWQTFYDALAPGISPDDMASVREALRNQAWMHYLEIDDEI
jgi:CRP-like cAMP-binding protein